VSDLLRPDLPAVRDHKLMFTRSVIARLLARNSEQDYVRSRWGDHYAKAAVGALTFENAAHPDAAAAFFNQVLQSSIVGRMQGIRGVGFNQRLIAVGSGIRGYWVAESKPKPLSKPVIAGTNLPSRKIAAIVVVTKEALEPHEGGTGTERALDADLRRAVTEVLDTSFIDASNAGVSGEEPASVTNGATPIASTDNPATDIAALISAFSGDLSSAYFITDPVTAAQIALARDASGGFLFPDAGPRGGSILGIPLLTSRSSPRDSSGGQLALVDASAIAFAEQGLRIDRSQQAALHMSDTPDDPTDASTVLVSLWQNNLVAMRAEIFANWQVQRTGAVAVITDANYPTVAS
jgi:HK97 family phage major capsid protein